MTSLNYSYSYVARIKPRFGVTRTEDEIIIDSNSTFTLMKVTAFGTLLSLITIECDSGLLCSGLAKTFVDCTLVSGVRVQRNIKIEAVFPKAVWWKFWERRYIDLMFYGVRSFEEVRFDTYTNF